MTKADIHPNLRRYIELCKRMFTRMREDGTLEEVLEADHRRRLEEVRQQGRKELDALLTRLVAGPHLHPLCGWCVDEDPWGPPVDDRSSASERRGAS